MGNQQQYEANEDPGLEQRPSAGAGPSRESLVGGEEHLRTIVECSRDGISLPEAALRESEERYRTLFQTMAQGVVYQSPDGTIEFANRSAEAILGLSLDQLQGRTSFDPMWRAVREDLSEFPGDEHPAMEALRTGKLVHDVVMGVFHPGHQAHRWLLVNAVPEFLPGETRPRRVYTTFSDITERKRMEQALRDAERRQSFLLTLVDALHALEDPRRIEAVATRALGEHLGASRVLFAEMDDDADTVHVQSDFCAPGVPSVVGTHVFRDFGQYVGEAMAAGRTLVVGDTSRLPGLSADERGSYVATGTAAYVLVPLVRAGRLKALLGVHQCAPRAWRAEDEKLIQETADRTWDSLDRARAETALRASEARYRDLYDNAPNAFFTVGADGRIRRCNRRAAELLGERVDALLDRPLLDLFADTRHGQHRGQEILASFRGGSSIRGEELQMRRVDGTEVWVSLSAEFVRDPEGRIVETRLSASDISDRKRAEAERDRAAEEATLQRGRAEAAAEADQRKDAFLSMLSHELRNPLAPIRNSLYVLERAAPDGEQARKAKRIIDRQVGHMTRLVDDLLDVTRISRGKVQLQHDRMDLGELIRRTVEDHRGGFTDAGLELRLSMAPTPIWVNGDWARLVQVIGNLLQNAAKFTPRGGETIVSVEADTTQGQAHVRVQDTGRGIDPRILPHLFQPFIQADETLDRAKGGLGLGLALVKGLVEMHGGRVSGESDGLGRGARFTVSLPLEVAPPDETDRRDLALHAPTRRVLVIEDSRDAAETLVMALRLEGHDVEVAYSGPEGIEKARSFQPEAVFCDIGLPVMDGYEVARVMRTDPHLGRAVLVALTGYARPEDVERSAQAGFDAHLAKPPDMKALVQILASSAVQP